MENEITLFDIRPISDEEAKKIHEFYDNYISGLIERNNMNNNENYHFFYNGPFSNFRFAPFYYQGIKYLHVEQFMMAHKAKIMRDYESEESIMKMAMPYDCKRAGREIKNFDARLWDDFKYKIVFTGCLQKFLQNGDLREDLMKTGDKILVEASPTDRIWGIGYSEDQALHFKDQWGENLLGKVLTEIKVILL